MKQNHLKSRKTAANSYSGATSFLFYLVLMLIIGTTLSARDIISLKRISSPIILDGNISETAWEQLTPLPLIMYQPTYGGTPSEESEIRVGYDTHYLYFSGKFYDHDPENIRVNSLYRDRNSGDDTFDILIDTFNDHENALWFWTNPAGVRGDIALSDDGGSRNSNWNTHWEVASRQNEQGWFTEIRIPFSSLGFQEVAEKIVMGLTVRRHIGRNNEQLIFPAIPANWFFTAPSQSQRVSLENIQATTPVYVTPYALGGVGQTAVEKSAGNFGLKDDFAREAGLDLKYNVTPNLTLDMTLNTDFAQVEADNQQVNLTRFSLFFPEKRQFFQERASIFSFHTVSWGSDRLFHSRRIGLENGRAVRILGGARMVGRVGAWDLGMINMQTEKTGGLPSENFGVLRLRRQVFNPYSYAGIMTTSRIGDDGSYNVNYGLDGNFRLNKNHYLTLRWAQTFDDGNSLSSAKDVFDAAAFRMLFYRRGRHGLAYWLSYARSGPDYLPELGFTTRKNFTEFFWWINYAFLMDENSRFRQIDPVQFFGFAALRNEDNSVESAQFEYDTDFTFKSGASIWADVELYYEDLRDSLFFTANSIVPTGSYTYFNAEGGYNMSSGKLLRASVNGGIGAFYDGERYRIGFSPTWNASRHLDISGQYQANLIRMPRDGQNFSAHIVRLRVDSAINTHAAINAFIQYNSLANLLVPNVRFRYNFKEGSDLWIVYDEAFNTDRRREDDLLLPRTLNRTILLKYTYTFQM